MSTPFHELDADQRAAVYAAEQGCRCDDDILNVYGCSCGTLPVPVPAVSAADVERSEPRWWNLPIAGWAWREDGRDRNA